MGYLERTTEGASVQDLIWVDTFGRSQMVMVECTCRYIASTQEVQTFTELIGEEEILVQKNLMNKWTPGWPTSQYRR